MENDSGYLELSNGLFGFRFCTDELLRCQRRHLMPGACDSQPAFLQLGLDFEYEFQEPMVLYYRFLYFLMSLRLEFPKNAIRKVG